MTPEEREHEEMRRRLWFTVAANVARTETAEDADIPGQWANEVLSYFDRAFPDPIPPVDVKP